VSSGPENKTSMPGTNATLSGSWSDDGVYVPEKLATSFVDDTAAWKPDEFAGLVLNPDTAQNLHFVIVSNSVQALEVLGDREALALRGNQHAIYDYHLAAASPLIDKGRSLDVEPDGGDVDDDLDSAEQTPLDLHLVPRFSMVEDGSGSGGECVSGVDMGAYERPIPCFDGSFGDMNSDGLKDGLDIQPFVDWCGEQSWGPETSEEDMLRAMADKLHELGIEVEGMEAFQSTGG